MQGMLGGDILQQSISGNCFLWGFHGIQLVATPCILFAALALDRWEFWTDGRSTSKGKLILTQFGLFRTQGEYGANPDVYYWNEQCEYIYPRLCNHMLWAGPVMMSLMLLLFVVACFALYASLSFKLGGTNISLIGELTRRATISFLLVQIIGMLLVGAWWSLWVDRLCRQATDFGTWRWYTSTRLMLGYPAVLILFWLPCSLVLDHTPPFKLIDFVDAGKITEMKEMRKSQQQIGVVFDDLRGSSNKKKPQAKPKGKRGKGGMEPLMEGSGESSESAWVKQWDEQYQAEYWYNTVTEVSTWEVPEGYQAS
eukprot:gb/GEZN01010509.1/.p1 GENE.gb/GEZN01010509.1/~~gb/GEZN01010509.1/.p1  ORF type:complete len:328 (+),score=45.00 gb/GEZN01010509.1/:53-985(+)